MKNDSIVFHDMDTHKKFTDVLYVLDGGEDMLWHLGQMMRKSSDGEAGSLVSGKATRTCGTQAITPQRWGVEGVVR